MHGQDQPDGWKGLTERVLESVESTPDDRLREIGVALVRHLHALVREVRLTREEWERAIDFLTRVGQTCSENRQEFVLLSDVLGVSMLVEELNAPLDEGITQSTVLGPFYVDDPPEVEPGASITKGADGVPLLVEGTVVDTAGLPCRGVLIDTWQSDSDGMYDVQYGSEPRLRGRLRSDEDGRFSFWSIVPTSYPVPTDGPVGDLLRAQQRHAFRPAHVHFRFIVPEGPILTTHLFAAGDPYLGSDVVFGERASLVVPMNLHDPAELRAADVPKQPFAWIRRTFVLPSRA